MHSDRVDQTHLIDGKYAIGDLVDLNELRAIFDKFTQATGFTVGFLDHPGLNVLIASGWKDICTKFHRISAVSAAACKRSNRRLLGQLKQPEDVVVERCENGLVDCAVPIIIKEKHIASLVTGQMLVEEPNIDDFRRQAEHFGFDVEEYLKALQDVRVVSEKELRDATAFLGEMAHLISRLGYSNLRRAEESARLASEILERRRAEEKRRESDERHRTILHTAMDGFWLADTEGRLLQVNESYCRMSGYSERELLALKISDLEVQETSDDVSVHMQKLIAQGTDRFESRHRRKDGTILEIEVSVQYKPWEGGRMVAFLHDITDRVLAEKERLNLESQLREAQKMEAIGVLAGGIAHDFNNILSPIIGYTEMALDDDPELSPVQFELEQVLAAAHRAKDLVKQILAFSRRGPEQQMIPVDISRVVKEALRFLRASLPSSIEIRQNLQKGVALADVTQLHQVIANLCTNAAHAMDSQGVLDVSLTKVHLSVGDLSDLSLPDLKPGAYLKLSVGDTGQGMSDETVQRIFEPYFTTKEMGKGTGLGLAVVLGIVKRHGAEIKVRRELGMGSVFDIYIPSAVEQPTAVFDPYRDLPGGSEKVLLIDDEQMIVHLGATILERLGYRVTAKTNARDALDLFLSDPHAFDLIITDYTMPGLTGIDLARAMGKARPGIPVLLCTGFSERLKDEDVEEAGIRRCVMKPLDSAKLAKLAREVLDAKSC